MPADKPDMSNETKYPFGVCGDCHWPRNEHGGCACGECKWDQAVKEFDDEPTAVVEVETSPGVVSWDKMAMMVMRKRGVA
jgi:hypothetical protein